MAAVDKGGQYEAILANLKSELDKLRAETQRVAQENVTSAEEAQQLSQLAKSGELGAEMQQAASLVAGGSETWDSLFSGKSANSALLEPIMQANAGKYGGELSGRIKGDPVPGVVE
ncbi:hypothetical protein [Nocardia altamirensis]|uniref:hypothetical protein n=1 Tax=Nocardia altamirensis TaxID=472158 RepID=UPI00084075C6|nr:hypothetical protein [Nocardia altamirensis]